MFDDEARRTPWDVYVDECLEPDRRSLGLLAVPNTASFNHKLHRCRETVSAQKSLSFITYEIHWKQPHGESTEIALEWLRCFDKHLGAKFHRVPWPIDESKDVVVLRWLARFCEAKRLSAPYNVVVFLDFSSDHAKLRIQNNVREIGRVARCYHLDSARNDCIQLTDLLLGAACRLAVDGAAVRAAYPKLFDRRRDGERLRGSETKVLIAGQLASLLDRRLKPRAKLIDFTT